MKIIDCTQGSAEWRALRHKRLTASNFDTVLHGGPKAWRSLALEMRSKAHGPDYPAQRWGKEHEPQARATYQLQTARHVRKVGFIIATDEQYGCSPDGLVSRSGMVEIKCPYNPDRHMATVRSRKVPEEYVAQIQGQLWIAERAWCDYVSFDPRAFSKDRIVIVRVNRDDSYIARLSERCALFMRLFTGRKDPVKHLPLLAPRFF